MKPDDGVKLVALELQTVLGNYEEKRKKEVYSSLHKYFPEKFLAHNE